MLRGFTDGNFYATSPQPLLTTWRIGEPLPQPLSLPVVLSGDPGPIAVAASARITAAYSSGAKGIKRLESAGQRKTEAAGFCTFELPLEGCAIGASTGNR
jgi:hypothetical protein